MSRVTTYEEAVELYGEDGAHEWEAYRRATDAERRAVIEGDPTPCELGEHLDVEGGRCLLCGELVIGGDY